MSISPTPNMIAEKNGPVGRLVFNKPQKHNATSSDMWEAIPVILDDFEKDPAIRVVVVTGAGDKAFVSGADISEFEKARSTPEHVWSTCSRKQLPVESSRRFSRQRSLAGIFDFFDHGCDAGISTRKGSS